MLKQIPNTLTIIRFLLIPLIIISLISGYYVAAFVLVILSGFTDIADGFIARKFDLVSNFGKLMDPLADKLTLVSILTTLVILKIIPLWILIVVIIKECTMVAGASFLYGKDVVVYSRWYGKLATVLFYLAIIISILCRASIMPDSWEKADLIVYCIALAMTVIALVLYIRDLSKYGVINKEDLNKDVKDVSIKKKDNKDKIKNKK